MRRRALLASAAPFLAASIAGCSSPELTGSSGAEKAPTARLEMSALDDEALPAKVLYAIHADGQNRRARLFERILNGGATTTATRPPLPEDQHIAGPEGVYELSYEVTDRAPATRYSVKVDVVEGSVTDAEAIRFSELPDVDKERFAAHGLEDGNPVGVGTTFLYTDAERERSVLVPDSEYSYVVWANGARAEWVVDDAYETTVKTHRYTAEQVATAAEYGRRMRDRFTFELSGLSAEQRDIVETAIADGHYVVRPDEEPSSALLGIADKFRGQEQAHALDEDGEDDLSGTYLVQYDGEVYWTTFVIQRDAVSTSSSDQ